MAKSTNSVQFTKAQFNLDTMELTEFEKEEIKVYDLLQTLKRFDGCTITLSVKEDMPVEQKDDEE